MVVSRETAAFIQDPVVQQWTKAIPNERTRLWYAYNLMRFLKGVGRTPQQFLDEIEKNPKQVSIYAKSHLGSLKSRASARVQMNALKSFTSFNEAPLSLNGLKIRVVRTRRKPYLTWTDAEKIINECKGLYRSAFKFLLWGGLGLDEFAEIQQSPEIQASIESQRSNDKPYIRIDLRPRKSNTDTYFVLVPKEYVPKFPLVTADYGNRGGKLIDSLDAEMNWQRARQRAGIRQVGLGPHTLRSAFRSQCARVGVVDAVAEFEMGHGSRDKYGYSRETTDESYVADELSKLWKTTEVVTATELADRDRRIAQLEAQIEDLRNRFRGISGEIVE